MQTIGILTYQDALNYGAAFQCKALYQYVKDSEQNCRVEVIRYINEQINNKTSFKAIITSKKLTFRRKIAMIVNSFFSITQRKKFQKFYADVSFSKEYIPNNICDVTRECDFYIIGSDQLWNFELNGGDINYLLPFADKNRVITYSTSIGKENIPDDYKEIFIENVSNMSFVSVREDKARQYINRLIPEKEIALTMDPVFLMDRNWWLELSGNNTEREGVGLYFFHKKFLSDAHRIIDESGLSDRKIHKICGGLSIKDFLNSSVKTGLLYGPNEVLLAINNCILMFTDSFHCVAICIILHIDFYVFLTGDAGRDSRITQLLEITGLTDRIASSEKYSIEEIEWEEVDKKIREMQSYSRNYLETALNSVLC